MGYSYSSSEDSDPGVEEELIKDDLLIKLQGKLNQNSCEGEDSEKVLQKDADMNVDCISEDDYFQLLIKAHLQPTWEIPALHTMTKNLGRCLNEDVKRQIAECNVPFKSGRFTIAEDKILQKNWNRMCRKFNLPNCPEIFARWRNTQNNFKMSAVRRKVLIYLGRNLENRTLAQIYERLKTSIGCVRKGRFSDEEKEIVELFIELRTKMDDLTQTFLCHTLGRDKHSIWRYLNKRNGEVKSSIIWNLNLTEKFIKKLLQEIAKDNDCIQNIHVDISPLFGIKIPWRIWIKVADSFNCHPIQLKVFWLSKVYVQLFAKEKIYLRKVRIKLIEILREKKYTYWQDINWEEVCEEFDNYTSLFLWRRIYLLIKYHCPHSIKYVDTSVNYLYDKFVVGSEVLTNKRLKRLHFDENGKLQFEN